MFRDVIAKLAIISGITVCWCVLFELNQLIFKSFLGGTYVSWVFLPAVLRMVSVLLFGITGAIGLFLGTILTSLHLGVTVSGVVMISAISALSPLIAISVCRKFLNVYNDLINLSSTHLLLMSFVAALFSSSIHTIYFLYSGIPSFFLKMFVGDLVGTLIVLYITKYALKKLAFQEKNQNNGFS